MKGTVRWLLEAGTFDCARYDCEKAPGEDCRKCGMPSLTPSTAAVIALHRRCRSHGTMPCAGGMLDQPEVIMGLFEVVDMETAAYQAEKRSEAESKMKREELGAKLRG